MNTVKLRSPDLKTKEKMQNHKNVSNDIVYNPGMHF